MKLFALGFVFGAWLLQQQAALPTLYWFFLLIPSIYFAFKPSRVYYLKAFNLLVFAGLLGFFWAATLATIRLSDQLPTQWQQKSIRLVGVIATLPEVTERGERFQFDVEKVLNQASVSAGSNFGRSSVSRLNVPSHITLNFYRENYSNNMQSASPNLASNFHAGERWQFTVRLKRPHTTYNPHGFDFEAWALSENVRATGNIHQKSGYKKLSSFVWRPSYIVEAAREKIGRRISQTLVDKPYAGVIRALVVGDDSQISQANWDVYLRTGTNHLMSISGLHITMLAGLAFALAAFFWRRMPSLVLFMPTRKAATFAGLAVAVLYALLAGMSVPTQRTLFMLVAFALALLFGRNLAISRALAIALIVVVLIDPWAVIAPGFWLSFSAVAMIAYVTVGRRQAQHWLSEAIKTQWAITIGLLPILIVIFGQTSIISPIANALAIPVISLIVVPLSIIGSLLPADFILITAHWVLETSMLGLNWLASLPMAIWQQAAPTIWTSILAMLGVLWLLLPRGFPQRWLGLILLLPLFFAQPNKLHDGELQASVLDVGQGLSVVIKTANHTLLYDAGSRYSAQSDAGSRIVIPYLHGEGIQKLDGFIVSHNDADHSGGATSVLAQMPVSWLLTTFDAADISPENVKKPTFKPIKCFAGQHWQWDKVDFEVLHPSWQSYQDSTISDNNRSCVVKVTSQFGRILLTGDIEKQAESALLQANRYAPSGDALEGNGMLKSDVLIAPHHGSKTSSTLDFIEAVDAKQVIFTVGYLNRFKHPKPLIEKRFEESGAVNYRSDYHGALVIDFTNNKPIQIKSWRQTQPKYWHDDYQYSKINKQ